MPGKVACWTCGKEGHIQRNCRNNKHPNERNGSARSRSSHREGRARAPSPLEEIDGLPGYAVFEPDLDDGRSDDSRIVTHLLSNDDVSDDSGPSRTRLSRDEVEVADGRSADTLSVEGATRREGNGNVGGAVHISDRETNRRDTRWKITGNPVHCTGDRTTFESLHTS